MSQRRPTYAEQERHLHEQYIAGKIEPYNCKFCVCGNLLPGFNHEEKTGLVGLEVDYWSDKPYSVSELKRIERPLLLTICKQTDNAVLEKLHPNYETALFNGMVAALKVLKEVHRGWGEDVDGHPVFVAQRELTVAPV